MHRLFILFFCIIPIWGSHPQPIKAVHPIRNNGARIVNGQHASAGQFPWQATIFMSYEIAPDQYCGGALISQEWILTTAHCLADAISFQVDLGSVLLRDEDPNRVTFHTNISIQHEDFEAARLYNDVGVIRLLEPVTYNDFIQPIELYSEQLEPGTTVTVSGFGRTSDDPTSASDVLNFVNLEVSEEMDCLIYGDRGDETLCAGGGPDNIRSTCGGDSGGALVLNAVDNPRHVGVASFISEYGCETGYAVGFAKTAHFREWIRNKTGV